MKRKVFEEHERIDGAMVIEETAFYAWLKENRVGLAPSFTSAYKQYLGEHGFDIKKHKVTEIDLELHKLVYRYDH